MPLSYDEELKKKPEDRKMYFVVRNFGDKLAAIYQILKYGVTMDEADLQAERNALKSRLAMFKDYAMDKNKIRHVVTFHADGGQMCVNGQRVFKDKKKADEFYRRMKNEKGHTCKNSVKQYETTQFVEDDGETYPYVASSGR